MSTHIISLKKGQTSAFRPIAGKPTYEKWEEEKKKEPESEKYAVTAQTQTIKDPKRSKSAKQKKPRGTITKLPARIKYPKWWKNLLVAGISLSGPGSQVVVMGSPGFRSFITTIVFTVTGETVIHLHFGSLGSSGPMNFGGPGEPRGISIPMSDAPAPIGQGSFVISSSGLNISVGGFVVYYSEPDEVPS